MKHVFISYSSTDLGRAEAICSHLEENGVKCWMAPRDIAAGADYTAAIPDAIADCDAFLLVMTGNAQSSHWVHNELINALSKGKKIIPFLAEKVRMAENYEFLLQSAQWEDGSENWNTALDRVVASLKGAAASGTKKDAALACPRCGSEELRNRPPWIGSVKQIRQRMRTLSVIAAVLALWFCVGFNMVEMSGPVFVLLLLMAFASILVLMVAGILVWLLLKGLATLALDKSGRKYRRLRCATCGKKFRKIVKTDALTEQTVSQ